MIGPALRLVRQGRHAAPWLLALAAAGAAQAQFAYTPRAVAAAFRASAADSDAGYRHDAARHLYARYPQRVFQGRLPPLLYGVAVVETEIDAGGNVVDVRLRRPPTAPEVGPWVLQMVRLAAPYPPPERLGGATYVDVWLVHRGGNFQLGTLTEGQD